MEDILSRLNRLDNVQLRTELLKHGEKVGPVTDTTRSLFLSKLAAKLYVVEHPESGTENAAASQCGTEPKGAEANVARGISAELEPGVLTAVTAELMSTPPGRKVTLGNSGDKEEPCAHYVVILADSATASSNAGSVPGKVKVSLGTPLVVFCYIFRLCKLLNSK